MGVFAYMDATLLSSSSSSSSSSSGCKFICNHFSLEVMLKTRKEDGDRQEGM